MTQTFVAKEANLEQAKIVLQQMLDGISSDPTSIGLMMESWWKRLMFRYAIGPRMLVQQMDTLVATNGEDDHVEGYFIIQYSGELAGTFDWALGRAMNKGDVDEQESAIFASLLSAALDHIENQERSHPYFYFGFCPTATPGLAKILQEEGMWLPDYQLVQLTASLPLAEAPSLPEGLRLAAQIPTTYAEKAAELIHLSYSQNESVVIMTGGEPVEPSPDVLREDVDAIIALHEYSIRSAKILQVERDGEAIGFVQQHQWRNELRLLLCFAPDLWGTDEERDLIAHLVALLGMGSNHLRLRTFSRVHAEKSKANLLSLGMKWEIAPWQRWMVGL